MRQGHQIIHCSCPDRETAEQLGYRLINEKLAACVNIIPGVFSIYPWQGKIETAEEHLLLIKTQERLYPQLASCIRNYHPYDVPEIVAVAIAQADPEYLQWIDTWLSSK
jgi:periplasmic divalent cation tolerance protein